MARFGVLCVFFLFLASCAGAEGEAQGKLPVRDVVIATARGERVAVAAELARSEEEQSRGLMFRKTLADGEGMLFIFPHDKALGFWMKNTLIPLSIAFIAKDGVLAEIHDMEPGSLRPVRSARSLRYALEVPQGWFARMGIAVGDALDLDAFK
jgi:uncharacterized membrane protein (UPF0127 family)